MWVFDNFADFCAVAKQIEFAELRSYCGAKVNLNIHCEWVFDAGTLREAGFQSLMHFYQKITCHTLCDFNCYFCIFLVKVNAKVSDVC